jgi:hypothetical protein
VFDEPLFEKAIISAELSLSVKDESPAKKIDTIGRAVSPPPPQPVPLQQTRMLMTING